MNVEETVLGGPQDSEPPFLLIHKQEVTNRKWCGLQVFSSDWPLFPTSRVLCEDGGSSGSQVDFVTCWRSFMVYWMFWNVLIRCARCRSSPEEPSVLPQVHRRTLVFFFCAEICASFWFYQKCNSIFLHISDTQSSTLKGIVQTFLNTIQTF